MNKTEEYLDSLLNNISPEKKAEEEQKKRKKANANFGEQFEKEVNDADMEKFIRDFEIEVDEDNTKAKEDEPAADSDDFWNNLEGIVKNANGTSEPAEPSEPMESEPESEPEATGTDFEINTLDDDTWTEQKTESSEAAESEAAESEEQPERSKEEQDLLNMIADLPSDEELSGLAESLRTDGQNDEADLNKMETGGTEETETTLTEEDTAKADKKQKKGFFKKLVSVLFGESEEDELTAEEATSEAAVPPEDLENMSEENRQILEELNAAGKAKEEDKPEDKEDNKKEKKSKKDKKQKPKKEKKPKEKKEKKPKKPKEVDLSPPLPRKPVILIFVMGISVILLVLLLSNLSGYSVNLSGAKDAYASQDYVEAYNKLAGAKIKEQDKTFYEKVALLASVQVELENGDALYNAKQYQMALDSYVCALGRYDANSAKAEEYNIKEANDVLAEQIAAQLAERFSVSTDTAREIYVIKDRKEYTNRIYEIVDALGLME